MLSLCIAQNLSANNRFIVKILTVPDNTQSPIDENDHSRLLLMLKYAQAIDKR